MQKGWNHILTVINMISVCFIWNRKLITMISVFFFSHQKFPSKFQRVCRDFENLQLHIIWHFFFGRLWPLCWIPVTVPSLELTINLCMASTDSWSTCLSRVLAMQIYFLLMFFCLTLFFRPDRRQSSYKRKHGQLSKRRTARDFWGRETVERKLHTNIFVLSFMGCNFMIEEEWNYFAEVV